MKNPVREPSVLDLTIDRPVAGGRMLARHEGRIVLVSGAIPGERVRAHVTKVARHVTWADAIEVIEASPDRRTPACDPACGGSAYAHIAYERQRQLKGEVIADAFRRIGKHALEAAVDVAASPETGYRLRARLHVRGRRAGFFREGTHQWCDAGATGQLLPESMAAIEVTTAALDARLAEIDALVLAENIAATERVVHIDAQPGARFDDLLGKMALPTGVTGLTMMSGGHAVALAGSPTVMEGVVPQGVVPPAAAGEPAAGGPGRYDPPRYDPPLTRHATSFFQANRYLVGALVGRVLEAASGHRFIDLYAGVGLFAVALAARGAQGLAVEGDRSSGADLDVNARPFRDRLRVFHGPVEAAATMPLDPSPDVVILDPPRAGVSPEALAGVLAWRAPRLVYVSCDPPTLARDAVRIMAAGYTHRSIDAFDLFPNTPHVEVVAVFEREGR